ncbi:MAG: SPOR domain-containing protein [Candidatus Omnitrophica bacterium]|nr:SPOR domain-containing protein [Candidatus Omnitrophota bacterium]
MKLFEKKINGESLQTLDEKEIQKRLYGRYHLETASKAAVSKAHHSKIPSLELPKTLKPSVPSASFIKGFASQIQGAFVSGIKKFPWALAGIVLAALTLSIISLQILSIWFGTVRESAPEKNTVRESKIEVSSSKPVPAGSSSALSSATVTERERPTPISALPQKRYYAVQVCTYQKESDAVRLTDELKNENFDAFYLRMASSQQRQPHYVVFLGKEETYAATNSKLNAFKKSRYFQQFSDSYIRSI